MADNTLATLGANSPVSITSISSLYILKALLAFVVVTLHCPLGVVPWLHIPGLEVNLFFAITGYFLYSEDREKVFKRIGKSIKKVIPIILVLQLVYYCLAPPFPLPSVVLLVLTQLLVRFLRQPSLFHKELIQHLRLQQSLCQ